MLRVRLLVLGAVGLVLGLACKSEPTEPLVATNVNPSQTALSFDALTATAQLTATVLDQNGQAMSGQTITWTTDRASVATVDDAGLVTAVGNGTATIRGAVGSVGGNVPVTVAQVVTVLEEVSGDAQTGTVATALPQPIVVLAKDRLDNNLGTGAGQSVTFAVTGGGGQVTTPTATFGANGQASTVWTLGDAPGANTVSASAGGGSVDFTATGELGPPDDVSKEDGDAQSAEVGTAVATPPRVRVTDIGGNALTGVDVEFVITVGAGGSLTGATVQTDAGGFAEVGSWTLDTEAGANELEARATGAVATFTATGTAGPAANITVSDGDMQSAAVNTAVMIPPAVLVADQFDNPVAGEMVDYAVVLGGGSVTGTPATSDADGIARVGSWTLGAATGPNTLDATLTGIGTVTFTATAVPPTPDSVDAYEGNNQTGLVGFAVNIAPAVIVLNAAGHPFQGATVLFEVASGGGSVTGETVITGADGIARVGSWVLGGSAGPNTLTATVQSGSPVTDNPVTFTANGITSQFSIIVHHLDTPTASQQAAFTNAAARWSQLVIGDLQDIPVNLSAGQCDADAQTPALNTTVDDVYIFVRLENIDGPGGTLGSARPCAIIRSSDSTAIVGIMRFDTSDLTAIEASGDLEEVILHEMGHVLGYGTLWRLFEFIADTMTTDPIYTGPFGRRIFDEVGGTNYTGGNKVPIETMGGSGTRYVHWRESVFDEELMTGFVNGGIVNPLSRVSTASLQDVNLLVNLAGSDQYTQVFSLRLGPPVTWQLHMDNLPGVLYLVDGRGRVIRRVWP